ncbi:MAG: transglutaminase domain-containing protein [Spirochaetes bacterium]|nr:transglutaminase domain-containing protein [Spirochaetota bacterium]
MKRPIALIVPAAIIAVALLCGAGSPLRASDKQTVPLVFHHESSEEPRVEQLLREFDFSSQVSAGLTEFQEMALLKNWVYSHIPYDLNYADSELRDSIRILRRAAKGEAFICTTISTVFLQTAVSMGWTPRQIILRKPTGDEHAGNDIWSNQYRKWVYIDPTWNIHVERRGVPLSISEIRREWLKNNGHDIVYVFGAGKNEKRYTTADLPVRRKDSKIWSLIPLDRSWLSYSNEIAVLGRNDFFSCCNPNGANAWDPMYVMIMKRSWKDRFKTFFSKSSGYSSTALFYDLNRVDIRIEGKGDGKQGPGRKAVEVRLNAFGGNAYTPNFMEYLITLNGSDWKVTGDRFTWKLEPGENVVRARVMNRFGVVGPIAEKRLSIEGKKKTESTRRKVRRGGKRRRTK